jgi:Fic family protein
VTCPPEKVADEIDGLFEWYEGIDKKTISVLAELHIRYERIHPFQDGNGRTGRLILYKECLRKGIKDSSRCFDAFFDSSSYRDKFLVICFFKMIYFCL